MTSKEKLILRHMGFARSVALKRRRGLSYDDVEDLVAEALLGLVEAADRFDAEVLPADLFLAFAAPRIRGRVVDAVKTIVRNRAARTNSDERALSPPPPPDPSSDFGMADDVRDAVLGLPPFEAWVVAARYGLNGSRPLSIQEIALDCGFSARRVETVIRSALDRLSLTLCRTHPRMAVERYFAATA